jgi:hypothetical protein
MRHSLFLIKKDARTLPAPKIVQEIISKGDLTS